MKNNAQAKDYILLHKLRKTRVIVIHQKDSDGQALVDHIQRIGCQVELVWPAPSQLPEDIDVVFFSVEVETIAKKTISWMAESENITRIAIISYETPEILVEIERIHVHGVLSKPIRIFGLLAVLTTALSITRYENRMKKRVKSLDETLKARRKIEQAVSILCESRDISEKEAYKRIRDKSMKDKCTIVSIAEAIVASSGI
ncbi:MAG: ANTAR domain-containing response regulator [Cellvibrionaceae bacterium]